MRRKILLESLAVGRCFSVDADPGETEEKTPTVVKKATPILPPANAWKITGETDDGFEAVSAAGEKKAFKAAQKVVEIPRQGWEKLAAPK